jgi:hypothetical protein
MESFCGAAFLNAQIYLKVVGTGKETIVSYKKDNSDFTECFRI